jgi:hypothetical protein
MTAVAPVFRWEVVKLLAQKRTYLGLGAAMLVPVVFVVVLVLQTGGPNDVPLGRYIRDTGLAVPFVVLFFMSIWGLPLITALVAGDIVAAESHNGTLKTILTRSRERGEVFAGKVLAALAYTVTVVLAMGLVALVAGSLAWASIRSRRLGTGRRRARTAPARGQPAIYVLPLAGIAAFGIPPLDGDEEQRRRGRRHLDVGALDAAPRRASGHGARPAVPARNPVRGVARALAGTCRPRAGREGRMGLRPLHRDPARRRVRRLSPA